MSPRKALHKRKQGRRFIPSLQKKHCIRCIFARLPAEEAGEELLSAFESVRQNVAASLRAAAGRDAAAAAARAAAGRLLAAGVGESFAAS